MVFNPAIAQSIEKLEYRVTAGDVAAQAGLNVEVAQQGLNALAADAGGHLQVAETGDIVYLFPRDFRGILRNKYWRLRFQENLSRIWRWVFYGIRLSFGVILILSIALMIAAIIVILTAANSNREGGDNRSSSSDRGGLGGNGFFMPYFWFGPNWFWYFNPDYNYYQRQQRRRLEPQTGSESKMNFLEAIFSFVFGDGNPNYNLEERRWQSIGTVIRNHRGAIAAEQIAPYLDEIDPRTSEDEDYVLPVLSRFNGYPEVSPQGQIVYYFPELQVTAGRRGLEPVADSLQEHPWRFSEASGGQLALGAGLGGLNLVLAVFLGVLLRGGIAAELGGFVAFVASIYGLLLAYALAFLGIPVIRYFWLQGRNQRLAARNQARQQWAQRLQQPTPELQQKLVFASQFAAEKVITQQDITYSTETGLLEQNLERADQIDEEWRRRLEGRDRN